ncbi:hypothetical protein VTI74DRAFT_1491 [Chaetomium olivicolor]
MGIHIILARSPADRASSVRITAIVAAILEAIIFVAIPLLSLSHVAPWAPSSRLRSLRAVWFGAGLLLCTVATAVSVSNLVLLSRVVNDPLSTILGPKIIDFMVGSSVVLGLGFATQLVFFVFHFLAGRNQGSSLQFSSHPDQHRRPLPNVKSIPYHETAPITGKNHSSFEPPTPPGSSGGRSATETMNSLRSSFSNVMRPVSRARLLSISRRSSHRASSLDMHSLHESKTRSTVEGFDSWDTSAVDPENRQTVLESSSPPPTRFLEPIPDSPTESPSPSPDLPVDILEPPPRTRRRNRSFSPVSTRTIEAQRAAFTQQESHSEAHIHPLFRSDSPIPPPSATPGTVVVAAPNAGQIIAADRQSIRSIKSMRRLRSDGLPAVPSPLSRAASCDSFMKGRVESGELEGRIREEEEDEVLEMTVGRRVVETERKMTPPIPEWILGAGSSPKESGMVKKARRSRTVGEEERKVAQQGL